MSGSTAAPRRLRTYARPRVSLLYVLRRTTHRLLELQVWDVAAAMTFFAALSLLPTVVALVSLVSLLGVQEETVDAAAQLATEIWPSLTPDTVREWILTLGSAGTGTAAVVLGILGAVVSASGAVGAFHRAMHRIHDTREGRPFLQFRLVLLVETLALMVGIVLVVILVVLGGDLSLRIGQAVGLPEETVLTWNVVKWPVILVVIALTVTLAYRLGPNVVPPRYRPLSAGAVSVVVLLFAATLALGWITDRFGQFAVVGRINSAIGVLVLAWIACIVLLAGAALDAEMLRGRQLAVGVDAASEIQLATRHTVVLEAAERHEDRSRRLARLVAEAVREDEDLSIDATCSPRRGGCSPSAPPGARRPRSAPAARSTRPRCSTTARASSRRPGPTTERSALPLLERLDLGPQRLGRDLLVEAHHAEVHELVPVRDAADGHGEQGRVHARVPQGDVGRVRHAGHLREGRLDAVRVAERAARVGQLAEGRQQIGAALGDRDHAERPGLGAGQSGDGVRVHLVLGQGTAETGGLLRVDLLDEVRAGARGGDARQAQAGADRLAAAAGLGLHVREHAVGRGLGREQDVLERLHALLLLVREVRAGPSGRTRPRRPPRTPPPRTRPWTPPSREPRKTAWPRPAWGSRSR